MKTERDSILKLYKVDTSLCSRLLVKVPLVAASSNSSMNRGCICKALRALDRYYIRIAFTLCYIIVVLELGCQPNVRNITTTISEAKVTFSPKLLIASDGCHLH